MDSLNLDDLYRSYISGKSITAIAKTVGINRKVLSKSFVKKGFKIRETPSKRLEPFTNDIKNLYKYGKALLEISKQFDTTPDTIKVLLVKNGVRIRTLAEQLAISKSANLDKDKVVDLYYEGRSISHIAALFGVSSGPIKGILTSNGIKTRSLSEQSLINSDFLHPNVDIEYFHNLNKGGVSTEELGRMVGIKGETIKRRLERADFPIFKYKSPEYRNIDNDKTISLFNNGMSTKALAEKFSVQRSTVDRFLKNNGVCPRGQSESMINRMANTPEDERKKLTANANASMRGRKVPFEEQCNMAVGREKACKVFRGERIAGEMLQELGIDIVYQKAVGAYNVDIFLPEYSVAVEIFGGHWHSFGHHAAIFRKRFDYIINSKMIPIIIWVTKDYPFEISAAKKVVSICKESRHNKAMLGHEHVLRGDGQCCAIGKSNLNYRS